MERLRTHVGDLKFDPEDPIQVLEFLEVYASQAEALDLSENEAFLALPKFLSQNELIHYRAAVRASSSDSRAIRDRPLAVKFLLRKYAANSNILGSLEDLLAISKQSDETEEDFFTRFEKAHARAGSPWEDTERITRFIKGVDRRVRPLILLYREENPMQI